MKLFISYPATAGALEQLRRKTADHDVWFTGERRFDAADRRAVCEAEVIFGDFPRDLLPQLRHVRWIQLPAVGIEAWTNLHWNQAAPQVVVTNLKGLFAEPMAQTLLGGILALNRGIDELARRQSVRSWGKSTIHPRLHVLDRASVLLLGTGAVNRRLRELLTPFRCSFVTYARSSGDIRTTGELEKALPPADLVCACLPDTPGTRGLLTADRISMLRPNAILANAGRGSLLDEPALVAALQRGRLGGAILDVTAEEPLSPESPLWHCPRLLLTQHTAAGSTRVHETSVEFFADNLERYMAGKTLLNIVNWNRGY